MILGSETGHKLDTTQKRPVSLPAFNYMTSLVAGAGSKRRPSDYESHALTKKEKQPSSSDQRSRSIFRI